MLVSNAITAIEMQIVATKENALIQSVSVMNTSLVSGMLVRR